MKNNQEPNFSTDTKKEKKVLVSLIGLGLVLFVLFTIKGDFFAAGYAVTTGHLNNKWEMNQTYSDSAGQGKHSDGVMMKGGKMMVVKSGKMSAMGSEMTLSDGTKVMADGTVIRKDGTKMMLKEGQHMDMSGKMVPMKKSSGSNAPKMKSGEQSPDGGHSPDSIPRKNY